jgi:AraC family transcriptional regulator
MADLNSDRADRSSNRDSSDQAPGISMRWHFATPLVRIAEWRCVAENGGLGEERSQPWHVIGFPLSGTYRLHQSGDAVLVDSNQVMFFNANVAYRTSHPHGLGDSGGSLILRDDLLTEILGRRGVRTHGPRERPFRRTHGPTSPRIQLLSWFLVRRISVEAHAEPFMVEELAIRLAEEAVRVVDREQRPAPRARKQHRVNVERVKDYFAETFTERSDLEELAALAGCSPFHLCRTFRRETGISMTAYRTGLRLGAALERIEEDLASLALDLGFSSHSHFSESFRRLFGVTPSEIRRLNRLRRDSLLRELARSLPGSPTTPR